MGERHRRAPGAEPDAAEGAADAPDPEQNPAERLAAAVLGGVRRNDHRPKVQPERREDSSPDDRIP